MKMTWKKNEKRKANKRPILQNPNLPFDFSDEENSSSRSNRESSEGAAAAQLQPELGANGAVQPKPPSSDASVGEDTLKLAEDFLAQGNELAEVGKYGAALGKWEAAINLMPGRAVLHEQKAQVLLEIGETWNALKAATCATELEPSWAEAWITLGRAQLNFGEPDSAIKSFDRALAIQPDSEEAISDRRSALHLVKRRKQLQSTSTDVVQSRYVVQGNQGDVKSSCT